MRVQSLAHEAAVADSEGNGNNTLEGTTVQPSNPTAPVDLWVNDGPGYGLNGTYNAFAYTAHHVGIIQAAAQGSAPFFVCASTSQPLKPCHSVVAKESNQQNRRATGQALAKKPLLCSNHVVSTNDPEQPLLPLLQTTHGRRRTCRTKSRRY